MTILHEMRHGNRKGNDLCKAQVMMSFYKLAEIPCLSRPTSNRRGDGLIGGRVAETRFQKRKAVRTHCTDFSENYSLEKETMKLSTSERIHPDLQSHLDHSLK